MTTTHSMMKAQILKLIRADDDLLTKVDKIEELDIFYFKKGLKKEFDEMFEKCVGAIKL